MTKIYTERLTLDPDEPHPFRAHIWTGRSDHHGAGATEAEALFNAAEHWLFYERKSAHKVPKSGVETDQT